MLECEVGLLHAQSEYGRPRFTEKEDLATLLLKRAKKFVHLSCFENANTLLSYVEQSVKLSSKKKKRDPDNLLAINLYSCLIAATLLVETQKYQECLNFLSGFDSSSLKQKRAQHNDRVHFFSVVVSAMRLACYYHTRQYDKVTSVQIPHAWQELISCSYLATFDLRKFFAYQYLCRRIVNEAYLLPANLKINCDELLLETTGQKDFRYNMLFEHAKLSIACSVYDSARLAACNCALYAKKTYGEQSMYYAESCYLFALVCEKTNSMELALKYHMICVGIYRHLFRGDHFLYRERFAAMIRCF